MCQKQQHTVVSPEEFTRLAQLANVDLHREKITPIKTLYQQGKATPRVTPGMNKIIDRDLAPFLVPNYSITGSAGVFTLPTDVEFIDTVIVGTKLADWKPMNLIPAYLDSSIDAPTVDYPIYADAGLYLQVYPTSLTAMKLTYLKKPVSVKWNYTLSGGRTPVYNATGTVNFEWAEGFKMTLVAKILGYMGISLRDGELKQYALQEEQKAH